MKNKIPRILISNDDGIRAQGLKVLVDAVSELGQVDIVAPSLNQSGKAHGITYMGPLRFHKIKFHGRIAHRVDGTPADCVKLAFCEILKQAPTLVLSGINDGPNWGQSLLYSGTVGAALEGTILGVSSIAFSLASLAEQHDFSASKMVVKYLVGYVLKNPLPQGVCLSVNIPPVKLKQLKGFRLTRQGLCRFEESFTQKPDQKGRMAYWMAGKFTPLGNSRHCDHTAIAKNFVSVTPISYDLSLRERPHIKGLKAWTSKFLLWSDRVHYFSV